MMQVAPICRLVIVLAPMALAGCFVSVGGGAAIGPNAGVGTVIQVGPGGTVSGGGVHGTLSLP